MIIIGVTGTNASGKDTVAEYLRDKYGFKNYSLSDEIRIELTKRGMDHSRENMITVGNEIREKFEANELAVRAIKRIVADNENKVIVTSIRNPAEVEELRKDFPDFKLIFIDAPIEIRYERSKERGRIGDGESFEDFKAKEARELDGGTKGQRLIATSKMADISIINDEDLASLHNKIEKILSKI